MAELWGIEPQLTRLIIDSTGNADYNNNFENTDNTGRKALTIIMRIVANNHESHNVFL